MAREQLKTLTEPMYYILLSLTTARHGYDVMQEITKISHGRVAVGAGTMYSLLARFEKESIIFQVSDDGRRKTYVLTSKGIEILKTEFLRIQKLAEDGKSILGDDYNG